MVLNSLSVEWDMYSVDEFCISLCEVIISLAKAYIYLYSH